MAMRGDTVVMAPVCEACGEEDEQLRRLLSLAGKRGLDVPNVVFRSPFLCAGCRERLCNLLRQIRQMERAEVEQSLGIPEPDGTPA